MELRLLLRWSEREDSPVLIKEAEPEGGIHLDFVPMIDTLFNLLVFFLLATTLKQVEREMQIGLPYAASAGPITATMRELVVNVDEKGGIIVDGRTIDEQALRDMVKDAVQANASQKVTVRGDRNTAYANIVRVLDICKHSGVFEPYLDTVPIPPG